MSKASEAVEVLRQPGDPKTGDSRKRWVVCSSPDHNGDNGRWLFGDHRLKATGYVRDCPTHAARLRGNLRIESGSGLESLTGAIYHLGEVVPNEPNKRYVTCPICRERHKEGTATKKTLKRRRGICLDCLPWALLALEPEDYARASSERNERYAKIDRIRKALKSGVERPSRGHLIPSMPFWTLAKYFIEDFPDAAPKSNKSKSTHVRYLTLFFEDKPIGEINLDVAEEFRRDMCNDISRWGKPNSESTVGRMVGNLKRMFSFAKENGWIKESPFPRGIRLYPRVRFKSDRIMTVNEDDRLRTACGDDLELLTSFLYMADTGIAQRTSLNLCWPDVEIEKGIIKGPGVSVEMTPRLADALRQLWESSGRPSSGSVFSRTSDHLYQDWERVRDVADVRGLTPTDIRRTCAWRMAQANKRESQIAAALGCALETVGALLVVDHATAESEINSPRFQQFLVDELGAPDKRQSGNEQENGSAEKSQHGGARNIKWTPEQEEEFVTLYEDVLPKIQKKDLSVPEDVRARLSLPMTKASDVALDYAAQLMQIESSDYLRKLITRVRKRRK